MCNCKHFCKNVIVPSLWGLLITVLWGLAWPVIKQHGIDVVLQQMSIKRSFDLHSDVKARLGNHIHLQDYSMKTFVLQALECSEGAHVLWAPTGSGKSTAAIDAAKEMLRKGSAKRAIAIRCTPSAFEFRSLDNWLDSEIGNNHHMDIEKYWRNGEGSPPYLILLDQFDNLWNHGDTEQEKANHNSDVEQFMIQLVEASYNNPHTFRMLLIVKEHALHNTIVSWNQRQKLHGVISTGYIPKFMWSRRQLEILLESYPNNSLTEESKNLLLDQAAIAGTPRFIDDHRSHVESGDLIRNAAQEIGKSWDVELDW